MSIYNAGSTCFRNNIHPEFMKFIKTLPIYILTQKNPILKKTRNEMHSFNLYDWSANCKDSSKVWQVKLRLWHVILQEIANVSSGQKIQESCQIYGLKFCLSLPVTFSVLVNVNQYQIYIHNREIAVFDFFPT